MAGRRRREASVQWMGIGGAKGGFEEAMETGEMMIVVGNVEETIAGTIAEETIAEEMVAAETAEEAVGATRIDGEEMLQQAAAGTLQPRRRCKACPAKQW